MHRDIKPDNILICKNGNIKICDFGISRKLKGSEYITDTSGTPTFMAPEVIVEKPYEPYAADNWSLGVLLYTLLNGAPPFSNKDPTTLKSSILLGEFKFKRDVSDAAKDLCK